MKYRIEVCYKPGFFDAQAGDHEAGNYPTDGAEYADNGELFARISHLVKGHTVR